MRLTTYGMPSYNSISEVGGELKMEMTDMAMMMCPKCHEMKMGPMGMKNMMMKCDGCGGMMKEMKMM